MLFSRSTHSNQRQWKPHFRGHQNHSTASVRAAEQSGQNLPSAVSQGTSKNPHPLIFQGVQMTRIMLFLGLITCLGASLAKAINH
jgi:hypothetical protein